MMRRFLTPTIGLVLVVGFSGCGERSHEPTILESRAQPYVLDIPVPRNFELDERRSTHDFSPGKRRVRHYYMGKAELIAVKSFYRQRMQEKGWELLDDQLKNGVFFLNFQNAEEICEVRIEEVPQGRRRTQVCVDVKRKY